MLKDLFNKKKYGTINRNRIANKSESLPVIGEKNTGTETHGIRCKECSTIINEVMAKNNSYVCTNCDNHMRIGARKRIELLLDKNSFVELDKEIETVDPLSFPEYADKIENAKFKSGENEGIITGIGAIKGIKTVICAMNPEFMMGSMGSVVGEKITRAIEKAIDKRLPVIIVCASGGARMQEGILSLMQMAKTSAALSRLADEGLLFISILTDPTTGGVTASYAMLGDIILAEPKALIGFAGPRVIEQTIRQKLPEGFQRSEFLLEKGFVDKIVHRHDMKDVLFGLLNIHRLGGTNNE